MSTDARSSTTQPRRWLQSQTRTDRLVLASALSVLALVILIALVVGGFVAWSLLSRPVVVSEAELEPLPPSLRIVFNDTGGCNWAGGEPGFEYRHLVITGSAGRSDDPLGRHLRAIGFETHQRRSDEYAPAWTRYVANRDEVRIFVGDLTDHFRLREKTALEVGPDQEDVRRAIVDTSAPLVLATIQPTGASCE